MPGKIRIPSYEEKEIQTTNAEEVSLMAAPRNSLVLYEHRDFGGGRKRIINVTEYSPTSLYSLHTINFKDCLSSLEWNLDEGIVVTLYEDHDGGGRQYQVWGVGRDSSTHNNNFKDCASSWNWYRSRS